MKKRKIIRPTEEEDRRINEGIAVDPDTYELDDEFFRNAKPAVRGPQKAPKKIPATVRYSQEVLETYRGLGRGWQTQMDRDLRSLIATKYRRVLRDGEWVTVERDSPESYEGLIRTDSTS